MVCPLVVLKHWRVFGRVRGWDLEDARHIAWGLPAFLSIALQVVGLPCQSPLLRSHCLVMAHGAELFSRVQWQVATFPLALFGMDNVDTLLRTPDCCLDECGSRRVKTWLRTASPSASRMLSDRAVVVSSPPPFPPLPPLLSLPPFPSLSHCSPPSFPSGAARVPRGARAAPERHSPHARLQVTTPTPMS